LIAFVLLSMDQPKARLLFSQRKLAGDRRSLQTNNRTVSEAEVKGVLLLITTPKPFVPPVMQILKSNSA